MRSKKRVLHCRLAQELAAQGILTFELARYVNVHPATARKWREGETIPNIGQALKIAELLCTKVEDLWFWQEPEGPLSNPS